jgi:ATP-dependent DNA ligase
VSRRSRLGFIPPQLPSLTEQPPEGANWIHEVKHDGYRTMLVIERGTAQTYTRNGHDWSDRYPGIIMAARKLSCRTAILDGEVIVQDGRGVSDFEALQSALRSKTRSGEPTQQATKALFWLAASGPGQMTRLPLMSPQSRCLRV